MQDIFIQHLICVRYYFRCWWKVVNKMDQALALSKPIF